MSEALAVTNTSGGLRLLIRVIPRSPHNRLDGVRAGRLLVRVTAPPVDEAANEAVIDLLAEVLGTTRRAVRIISGATSRNKTIEVSGLTEAQLREAVSMLR
jgi:uncharacterized protein (TIGR00251 family)